MTGTWKISAMPLDPSQGNAVVRAVCTDATGDHVYFYPDTQIGTAETRQKFLDRLAFDHKQRLAEEAKARVVPDPTAAEILMKDGPAVLEAKE